MDIDFRYCHKEKDDDEDCNESYENCSDCPYYYDNMDIMALNP